MIVVAGLSNSAPASTHMRVTISNPSSTTLQKTVHYEGVAVTSPANLGENFTGGGGVVSSAIAALTGVRFLMSSGNIVAGSFKLYGLRKSI